MFNPRRWILPPLLLMFTAGSLAAPSGKEFYEEVIKETPIYEDKVLQDYIRNLGEKIVAQSEMAGKKFTFTLLDSPELNAFATRDNYIYVNRGLLSYMENEAQLVSVLAHEVAHVTEGHVNTGEGSATGAQIISAIAAILTNSAEVYEAGLAYANSLIRGRGRENELEADATGAVYMAKLGYNTDEMIQMLSIMKDNESLQKARAADKGAPRQTYHGVFSTHPRNDARLRSAVGKSRNIGNHGSVDNGAAHFRKLTNGLIWGENFLAKNQKPERYSNMKLRVRFDYPDGWTLESSNDDRKPGVTGQPEDKAARLTMQGTARTSQSPEEFLYNYLKISQLKDGKAISPARLKGFTGILSGDAEKPDTRIAVVYYKYNAYLFSGEVTQADQFAKFDELFLKSINTFRPITQREIDGQKPKRVHYVKATSATTFEAISQQFNLNKEDSEDLRLINGYYPSGQPKPGEWIKIFKQ